MGNKKESRLYHLKIIKVKKLDFEKFTPCKVKGAKTIVGGTATSYNRADFGNGATGTGKDTNFGDGCTEFHDDAFVHCG